MAGGRQALLRRTHGATVALDARAAWRTFMDVLMHACVCLCAIIVYN